MQQCGEPPRPRAGQASPGRRCPNPRPQAWAGQVISAQTHRRVGQAGYYVPMYLLSVDLDLWITRHQRRDEYQGDSYHQCCTRKSLLSHLYRPITMMERS